MSLTRDHGDIVFQCDGCKGTLQTGTSNWESARNLLKRAHWKAVRKPGGREGASAEWENQCPGCQRWAAEQRAGAR